MMIVCVSTFVSSFVLFTYYCPSITKSPSDRQLHSDIPLTDHYEMSFLRRTALCSNLALRFVRKPTRELGHGLNTHRSNQAKKGEK